VISDAQWCSTEADPACVEIRAICSASVSDLFFNDSRQSRAIISKSTRPIFADAATRRDIPYSHLLRSAIMQNMTSSTKPEVQNVQHCRQKRTDVLPPAIETVSSTDEWFSRYANGQV